MKLFADDAPRDQVRWLLLHGIVIAGVYALVLLAAVGDYARMTRDAPLQYFIAVPGIAVAAAAGLAIVSVCAVRLRRPFRARKMRIDMRLYVVAELILLFFFGTQLMGGAEVLERIIITLSLSTNLALLVTLGRTPAKDAAPSPLADPPKS